MVVVGAGPTGLMLACELALGGANARLLEERTDTPNITRAFAVHARTLELLDARGLAEELMQRRQELLPEFEMRLKHLEGCLGKLPDGQRSLVEGYYFERADIETLSRRSGRSAAATYKMLQRIRHALQLCVEGQAKPEVA